MGKIESGAKESWQLVSGKNRVRRESKPAVSGKNRVRRES